ncbi:zinc finger CCCH domain-containing protein 13-like [Saccostrea cucullata]|uniref:zinc finger CCCH domain-containing protein 13-like n=1 Tax=Saccostrea cuccullata TaxID=36930 RepID=UPI002ED64322
MDEVDSPFLKKKRSHQKLSDTRFQSELQMKLQQRRQEGLTYGLTSEESDSIVDDDDGDSDEEILAQHRRNLSNQKQSNRPTSAKRRTPTFQDTNDLSLGDTIRPGQGGSKFMKQRGQQGQKESIPSLNMGGKGRTSPGMPSLTSPKLSPKDSKSLTDALGGKRSPSPKYGTQPMSQEDIIFGRKTPTNDPRRQSPTDNKPWQPPNFRKSPGAEQQENRAPSPGLQGRRTPSQEPFLQSIDENAGTPRKNRFPSPIDRSPKAGRTSPKGGLTSPKDRFSKSDRKSPKSLSIDDSPRLDEAPKPRPRHKTDIFGKTDHVDVDLETDSPSVSRFHRTAPGGRKTPTQMGRKTPTNLDGRKTPTGMDGRKTPTGLDGRKTPTDKTSYRKSDREKDTKKAPLKKETSLLDFLNEDVDSSKTKKREEPKPRLLRGPEEGPQDREDSIRDDILGDKINRAKQRQAKSGSGDIGSADTSSVAKKLTDKEKEIPDDSSLCEEFDKDPLGRSFAEQEKQAKPGKGRTESKKSDDIINKVAQEQNKPASATMKSTDTTKSFKKVDKEHRPKPRYTIPGTPTSQGTLSEMSFNDTMSIRQAVYDEWRREKMKSARKEKKEEEKKKQEEEKKKEDEKKEKKLENESSYRTWKESKEDTFVKKIKEERRKEREKKEKIEKEKEQKIKEAEKTFKIWKEEKDEEIKEKLRKKREEEREKEYEKEQTKKNKEKENVTALRGWNNKKEQVLKEKVLEEKKKKMATLKEQEQLKKEQEREAEKLYDQWLRRKDDTKRKEKSRRYGSTESIEFRPAWSPASKTIPFGR